MIPIYSYQIIRTSLTVETESSVCKFLYCVTDWALCQPTISGVALVGSHARREARPDSDIDLVLVCSDPQVFLSNTSWLSRFGEVVTCQTEDWGLVTSLRVVYRERFEVEFGITSLVWAALPVDSGTKRVVLNGMRIHLDRDGYLARLQKAVKAS